MHVLCSALAQHLHLGKAREDYNSSTAEDGGFMWKFEENVDPSAHHDFLLGYQFIRVPSKICFKTFCVCCLDEQLRPRYAWSSGDSNSSSCKLSGGQTFGEGDVYDGVTWQEKLRRVIWLLALTEAARLCTSQAELKDGTTRAPIVWFLSCQRATELKPSLENPDHFETPAVIFNRYHQDIYETTNCSLYIGWETMATYGSVFLSDDSPDMDVIGISDNFFSDNKPAAVNCIEGYGSSLGRFKSHVSNIVFDVFIATCQDPAQNMESSQIDGSH
ncbi:hypothetical protein Bca101_035351 [Brassica carinata]